MTIARNALPYLGGDFRKKIRLASLLDPRSETLLVLSDVHLGSDLDDFAHGSEAQLRIGEGREDRPSSPASRRRSPRIDADLVALLRHYRRAALPPAGQPSTWRLVVAGDFIDFLGMTIRIDADQVSTAPSAEEAEHGLGNAEDHARLKLERVLTRHADVFDELAAFVADGHAVTFVHGNHDLEFHWPAVQTTLKTDLLARAHARARDGAGDDEVFLARIDFAPWFFYRDGVAYIEHGHQYDRFCATDHVMAPLSPLDPRRIARGFCDVLLRFVVRPTRGMSEHGHEDMGMLDYLRFAARLGLTGMAKLGIRFSRAILELFRLRRSHFAEAARTLRAEHERRMAALSEATRIGLDKLRALAALQSPPITRSVRGILASLLLDRLAVAAAGSITLLALAIFVASRGRLAWSAALVVAAWYGAHWYLSSQRQLDPRDQMRDRAGKLAKLFPAAFVVMGHTHVPERVPVAASAATSATTYINLGSWAEEEETTLDARPDALPDQWKLAFRAARTHLVIRPLAEGAEAEFLTWDPDTGPKRYDLT